MTTKALNSLRISKGLSGSSRRTRALSSEYLLIAYGERVLLLFKPCRPASVAQSDARPTGD